MITEERVLELFAQDNPIPDVDELDLTNLESPAYLATLEQRSSEVTQLDTRETETSQTTPSRRWLAAAAAAVVVLGVAWAILSNGSEEAPVVTDPTPTTVVDEVTPTTSADATPTTIAEVVDPRVEEGLAVGTAFAEAYVNLDDVGTAEHGLVDSGRWDLYWGLASGAADGVEGVKSFVDAIGLVRTVDECGVASTNAVGVNVACTVLHETSFSNALGVEPIPFEIRFAVRFEGEMYAGTPMDATRVVERTYTSGTAEFQALAWGPLVEWMERNHPEDDAVMFNPWMFEDAWVLGNRPPFFTPEAVELWGAHVAEFNAEHGQ